MVTIEREEEKFTKSVLFGAAGFGLGYLWGRFVVHRPPWLYGKLWGISAFAHSILSSFLPSVVRGWNLRKVKYLELCGHFLIDIARIVATVALGLMCPETGVAFLLLQAAYSTYCLWGILVKPPYAQTQSLSLN